jgi:hypothetical protein
MLSTRCVQAASLIGGRALLVNAVDGEAAKFWRRRGFEPSRDDPLVLLLLDQRQRCLARRGRWVKAWLASNRSDPPLQSD